MKLRSNTLNLKAVINHFGVSRKLATLIDKLADGNSFSARSLLLFVNPDGSASYDFSSEPVLIYQRKPAHGLLVCWPFHTGEKVGVSIVAPWRILAKSAPDTGHIVYSINLRSPVAMYAGIRMGGYVFADKETRDEIQNKEIIEAKLGARLACYVGKTSQGAALRLKQHIDSAIKGSKTVFHRRIAGDERYSAMVPAMTVIDSAPTSDAAYDIEELMIKESAEARERVALLNMVSSRAAIADLFREFPEIRRNVVTEEMAEELLQARRLRSSLNWDDPDYAQAVICNNVKNFDSADVRLIRMLFSLGDPVAKIAASFGVHKRRVQDIVSGATYRRIL